MLELTRLFYLWKFRKLEGAGHLDIETSYSDDILDDLISLIEFLSPEVAAVNKKIKEPPSIYGKLKNF